MYEKCYDQQFYKQMEEPSDHGDPYHQPSQTSFEQKTLHVATLKPKLCLRYVDNIFVISLFGKDELSKFKEQLNKIQQKIYC